MAAKPAGSQESGDSSQNGAKTGAGILNRTGYQETAEMKNSKEFSGFDSYAAILNFDFCLLNSSFTPFILTPDF